jgi:uncharacterized protein (TIGR00255 family)
MKSMTGYGSAEGRVGKGVLFAEVRSVNSRFLDVNCKIPFSLYCLESKIKKTIQSRCLRGKIDIFIKERKDIAETFEMKVNTKLVEEYKKCLNHVVGIIGSRVSSHLLEVVDLKDLLIIREKPLNAELFWKQIERVILNALLRHDVMRRKEGDAIKRDQLKRLLILERSCSSIGKVMHARQKGIMKSAVNGSSTEASSVLDKFDVTEELTRLKSHIAQYRSLIRKSGGMGRQLDFLIQEMHREINTLGSKASNSKISGFVVMAKTEIEKLREQAQNIE